MHDACSAYDDQRTILGNYITYIIYLLDIGTQHTFRIATCDILIAGNHNNVQKCTFRSFLMLHYLF